MSSAAAVEEVSEPLSLSGNINDRNGSDSDD
jgi:hypothetical protein